MYMINLLFFLLFYYSVFAIHGTRLLCIFYIYGTYFTKKHPNVTAITQSSNVDLIINCNLYQILYLSKIQTNSFHS